ncbi:UNVERIFIED_CONTAM: MAP3K epsilon protein kinase [Sesamum radiatum]|uniref:MAP3K epsilon protein kinase n=1 Tax=Sesamum radiatum TaxID=300843 RepID=A0AAW2TXE7_SESRA
MVHMAIDGMWQVFKLQKSTFRNDFCRIAAKNGILLRLINTLYSLNESTRLASIASGSGVTPDGVPPQPRYDTQDSSNSPFVQMDYSLYGNDQPDNLSVKQGDQVSQSGLQEPSRASVSRSPDSRFIPSDADRPQSSINVEASGASRVTDPPSLDRGSSPAVRDYLSAVSRDRGSVDRLKNETSRADDDLKQQRGANAANRTSTDRAPKSADMTTNGSSAHTGSQQENVRPLLSLLDKEPPSRHFSEVSGRGRENANVDSLPRNSPKATNKKLGPPTTNGGIAATSGLASQRASGVLSGSGVLNARPGSATSSGLLSHMVSPWNVDVAREYLER